MKRFLFILFILFSFSVNSQGFTPLSDEVVMNPSGFAVVNLNIKNYNEYKQRYLMTRNGDVLKGELRLYSKQSRRIRVKLIEKGYNKICMVSLPTEKQNRAIAFCDTILVK